MINALDANNLSTHNLISYEEALRIVLTKIDNKIKKHIKHGEFCCQFIIHHPNAERDVRLRDIKDIIVPMGYYIVTICESQTWFWICWDKKELSYWRKFCMWWTT